MQFRLAFNMDNDDFAGEYNNWSVVAALDKVTDQLTQGHTSGAVMDRNGNKIGNWEIVGSRSRTT
jgi:hypothetical protein